MQDLEVELDWFKYNETEMVVKGDQILEDGRRIILFSSNDHLEILACGKQILSDGTFSITPKLWTQVFIISVQVSEGVFIPVCFALLPDKKHSTCDAMFGMLREAWS